MDWYDEFFVYVDFWIHCFVEGLREWGLFEKIILIIIVDYGVGLCDWGWLGSF